MIIKALQLSWHPKQYLDLEQVKARGEPDVEDGSVAALLLRLRDPNTGAPLPDELLAGEFGVFFTAGIESAGHAITWTLCA